MPAETIDISEILSILGLEIKDLISQPFSSQVPESLELPKDFKLELVPTKGIVIDADTREPIRGVTFLSPLKIPTRTNGKGEFETKAPKLSISGSRIPFDVSKFQISTIGKVGKYSSENVNPYLPDGDVKSNLGIISLSPIQSDLVNEIRKLFTFNDEEVEEYVTRDVTYEFWGEKRLSDSIKKLKQQIIPLILGLISQYGISKVEEKIQQIKNNNNQLTEELKQQILCPVPENLSRITKKVNNIFNKLNQVYTTINATNGIIQTTDTTIQTINIAYQTLKFLPTPSAVGGVGIPISVINNIQDIKNFLDRNLKRFSESSNSLSIIIGILSTTLGQVLDLARFLDLINQYCAQSSNENKNAIELTTLTTNQQALQTQLQSDTTPSSTQINGFTFDVETEPTTNDLKRKRAVAKNSQGTILLRGEYSYSSLNQVLIDELAFYIKINDLKAD